MIFDLYHIWRMSSIVGQIQRYKYIAKSYTHHERTKLLLKQNQWSIKLRLLKTTVSNEQMFVGQSEIKMNK